MEAKNSDRWRLLTLIMLVMRKECLEILTHTDDDHYKAGHNIVKGVVQMVGKTGIKRYSNKINITKDNIEKEVVESHGHVINEVLSLFNI